MVRYFIINNSGNEDDARDVFQEVVLTLFEQLNAGKFEQRSSLKTWIYAVCRNKWMKQLAKRKKNVRLLDFENFEALEIPEEGMGGDDRSRDVRKSLEQLGLHCRQLLLLFYYFRKSMDEIATDLGYTNADNAKSQKYKCLQKLKTIHLSRK